MSDIFVVDGVPNNSVGDFVAFDNENLAVQVGGMVEQVEGVDIEGEERTSPRLSSHIIKT